MGSGRGGVGGGVRGRIRVQCTYMALWAGPGAWSAAVVDAQALGDVLAAQRAGAQGRAALLTAAHVAAIEENHLGLPFQTHHTL